MNSKVDIYEPDEIKAVFDFLKTAKTISDITESSGVSTIYTNSLVLLALSYNIYLTDGMYVTINNVNYQVDNVNLSAKTFTIVATGLFHMSTDLIPVKILDATSWKLGIDFKFGSRKEINQLLANEISDETKKNQRFPLAWLFINESRNHDSLDYDFKTSIKLAFVHLSNMVDTAENRKEKVFKPVLTPLKTLFLEAIQSSYFTRVFNWEYTKLNYSEYYRYFYGSSDKNQMVFDAPTDAIEIDLDVIFENQYY